VSAPQHPDAEPPAIDQTPPALQHPLTGIPKTDQTPPAGTTIAPKQPTMTTEPPDLATRLCHVGQVTADGLIVGTVREGLKQSCEDPLGTAVRAGTAVALGAAFGIATGGIGLVAEAACATAAGLSVAGAWDFLNPFDPKNTERNDQISSNLQAAWTAAKGARLDACDLAMEKALGRPGFDFALGTLGGFAGAKFARPFVPPPAVGPPSGPRGTALVKLGPSTDLVAPLRPTQIVPLELLSDFGTHDQVVDAEFVKVLETTQGGIPRLETTKGGPKAIEDKSKPATY
jgi:hypothetical protein